MCLMIKKQDDNHFFVSDGIVKAVMPFSTIHTIKSEFKEILTKPIFGSGMDYVEFDNKRYRIIMDVDNSLRRGLEWRFYKELNIAEHISHLELDCKITIRDKDSIKRLIKYMEEKARD